MKPIQEGDPAERAVRWLEALKRAGPEERGAFADWLQESPVNPRLFIEMAMTEAEVLKHISPGELAALAARAEPAASNVIPLWNGMDQSSVLANGSPRAKSPVLRWVAVAAAVMAVFVGGAVYKIGSSGIDYQTHIGEQRTVELDDRSLLRINTDSRVVVHFTRHARDLELLRGEAKFDVAHDAARPFLVRAGEATVKALGTKFTVYLHGSTVKVTVLEGTVEIFTGPQSARTATRGEEAIIEGGVIRTRPLNTAITWQGDKLVFVDAPLGDIAAEFNRYNRALQIRVEGVDVAAKTFGGTFEVFDPSEFLKTIAGRSDLVVVERGGEMVIQAAPDP